MEVKEKKCLNSLQKLNKDRLVHERVSKRLAIYYIDITHFIREIILLETLA